jgi:hypothetical protein
VQLPGSYDSYWMKNHLASQPSVLMSYGLPVDNQKLVVIVHVITWVNAGMFFYAEHAAFFKAFHEVSPSLIVLIAHCVIVASDCYWKQVSARKYSSGVCLQSTQLISHAAVGMAGHSCVKCSEDHINLCGVVEGCKRLFGASSAA